MCGHPALSPACGISTSSPPPPSASLSSAPPSSSHSAMKTIPGVSPLTQLMMLEIRHPFGQMQIFPGELTKDDVR